MKNNQRHFIHLGQILLAGGSLLATTACHTLRVLSPPRPELAQRPCTEEEYQWSTTFHKWFPDWQEAPNPIAPRRVPATPSWQRSRSVAPPARVPPPVRMEKVRTLKTEKSVSAAQIAPKKRSVATVPPQTVVPHPTLPRPIFDFPAKRNAPPSAREKFQLVPVTSLPVSRSAHSARTYTIRKGDTLRTIARHFYGNEHAWKKILAANRRVVKNPDQIHPGMRIVLPR